MPSITIEALETLLIKKTRLEAGDRLTFTRPDEYTSAVNAINRGWAKDTSGEIKTGERRVIKATIQPHKTVHRQKAQEPSNG